LMRARIAANESAGAATVRSINTAEATYATTYASAGFAPNLALLGPNGVNCTHPANVTPHNACLLDSGLGCKASTYNKTAFSRTVSSKASSAPCSDYFVKAISVGVALAEKDYCSGNDEVVHLQRHTLGSDIAGITSCVSLSAIQ